MPDLLIIQNVACEGPGVIETLSQRHGLSYTLRRAWEEDVLRNSSQFAALIILGGPMNVYEEDRYPFLKAEGRLIRQFLEDGKPILGICLGAQLLARALGAKVFAGPQKEIGWYPVWLTPEAHLDAVFQILGKRFMAFHWHGDTFELPYGAIHLARSSMYTHQAFRLGEKAYGVQFHLEVTPKMIQQWIKAYHLQPSASSGEQNPDAILANTKRWGQKLEELATVFFTKFFSLLPSQTSSMHGILSAR